MKTTILMSLSALFTGAVGLVLSFLPQETLVTLGAAPGTELVVLVQVAGGAYLGFAFLDWMARGVLIGGIYSRPLALGNFLHFAIVAVTLLKAMTAIDSALVYALAAIYSVFAAWFGLVLFTSPVSARRDGDR